MYFAKTVFLEYGSRVHFWCTINEHGTYTISISSHLDHPSALLWRLTKTVVLYKFIVIKTLVLLSNRQRRTVYEEAPTFLKWEILFHDNKTPSSFPVLLHTVTEFHPRQHSTLISAQTWMSQYQKFPALCVWRDQILKGSDPFTHKEREISYREHKIGLYFGDRCFSSNCPAFLETVIVSPVINSSICSCSIPGTSIATTIFLFPILSHT